MERVTAKQLEGKCSLVNGMFKGDIRVELEAYNGGHGLVLCDSRGQIRSLTFGTKREVATYLDAMRETLYIVGRD